MLYYGVRRLYAPGPESDGYVSMNKVMRRPLLIALILIGVCIGTYIVGIFYSKLINNPLDFAALIFIIAMYVGAAYHQVRNFEKK